MHVLSIQNETDKPDYLDPSQSGFRPGYGTETALIILVDDLHQELDRGNMPLLVLLDLPIASFWITVRNET